MQFFRGVGRIIGLPLLLGATLLLAACGPSKFAYNNAPELLYWWLDGYLDFNDAQSEAVRADLRQFQAWHRKQEAPRYAEAFDAFAARLPADLTPEPVCRLVDDTRAGIARMARQIEPAAARLALTLTPGQLDHLRRKYDRTNADYRKKWLEGTPDERLQRRFKQAREQVELVYGGGLGDAQWAVLRQQVAASRLDARAAYDERLRRQDDLLGTLRRIVAERPPPDAVQAALRGVAERALRSPDAGYRAYAENLQRQTCADFAALHNSTTPEQRAAAVRKLKGYAADLRELAAQD